ncbi:organomercurial lyase [Streptomyces sp. CG1]|uniref:organomercurial lyase n=1 Tax=Streptomyces sp. CG1 TaxID=1287523 RepID=UPI0034E1E4D1
MPELATLTGLAPDHVRRELRTLHGSHDVVLNPQDNDQVVMAHPFASVPLGFSVMGAHTLWWGGCARDSFAMPHLIPDERDVLVTTRCPACDTPHAWVIGRETPPQGDDQVAHFLIPMSRAWDDVVHTCGNQRLFCSTDCVDTWLQKTGRERGHVMDLGTLWRLARDWYTGRLEPGYTRRDPVSAAAYLAEVGLHGSFWGLPDFDLGSFPFRFSGARTDCAPANADPGERRACLRGLTAAAGPIRPTAYEARHLPEADGDSVPRRSCPGHPRRPAWMQPGAMVGPGPTRAFESRRARDPGRSGAGSERA